MSDPHGWNNAFAKAQGIAPKPEQPIELTEAQIQQQADAEGQRLRDLFTADIQARSQQASSPGPIALLLKNYPQLMTKSLHQRIEICSRKPAYSVFSSHQKAALGATLELIPTLDIVPTADNIHQLHTAICAQIGTHKPQKLQRYDY